jgi:hypothetical protein
MMESDSPVAPRSPWRSAVVSIGSVVAAVGFVFTNRSTPLALWLPAGLLLGAAALVWRGHLGSELMVRAVLWSNLVLGFMVAVVGMPHEQLQGGLITFGTGIALLVLGRGGLERPSESFSPAAFRGSLVLALVMALADTQSLALFAAVQLERARPEAAYPLLACAGSMVLALVGLYRLRLWGLVLNIVANVAIAGLALTGRLDMPDEMAWVLATTALIQLALPLPLVVALVRGRPPAEGRASRLADALVPAVIVAMLGVAACGLAFGRLLDLD